MANPNTCSRDVEASTCAVENKDYTAQPESPDSVVPKTRPKRKHIEWARVKKVRQKCNGLVAFVELIALLTVHAYACIRVTPAKQMLVPVSAFPTYSICLVVIKF